MLLGIASVLCLCSILGIGYTVWQMATETLTAVAPLVTLTSAGAAYVLFTVSLYY